MKDLIIPTKDITKNAVDAGKDLGVVVLAMGATHAGLTAAKKRDSIPVNIAVAGAGFAAAVMLKNPLAKLVGIGICAYGTINSAGLAMNQVTKPGTQGIAGLLPESVKEKLRTYIPQFAGTEDLMGNDFSNIPSMDEAANGVGRTEDVDYETISSSVNGLGRAAATLL